MSLIWLPVLCIHLSVIVAGAGDVCTAFQSNSATSCVENIVAGIIYPKLCRSPLCRLEGKLNNLLAAALSDFFLHVIVVVLMTTIYFAKCDPGERTKLEDL